MTRFPWPTAIALSSAAIATVIALSACNDKSNPPSALSVVKSDGYTVGAVNVSAAEISADMGSASNEVSSAAGGVNSSGNFEVVMILTDSGAAAINSEGGQAALQTKEPKATVVINGDIVRMTGSVANFTSLN